MMQQEWDRLSDDEKLDALFHMIRVLSESQEQQFQRLNALERDLKNQTPGP